MNKQQTVASEAMSARNASLTLADRLHGLWSRLCLAAWVRSPGGTADLMALALAGSLGLFLSTIPVGSGDYGQWLMLSRYYLGQSVPDYREVASVPPLMPMALAATRVFVSDPLAALQVFKGVVGAAFVLSTYLAGAAVFRFRAAGVLVAVFAFLVSDRLVEGFAFGGLPQLFALIFINFSVAAFAQASNDKGLRLRWWILGSISIVLAAISHVGTGSIAMAVGVSVAVASLLRARGLSWRERGLALVPLAVVLVGLATYWLRVVLPSNQEYTQNPASLAYRGQDRVFELIWSYSPNTVLLVIGALFVVFGCTYELLSRRPGAFFVAGAWAATVWAILAVFAWAGIATDYPRFIPALMAPLAVAAGGGIALLSAPMARLFREPFRAWAGTGVPLILSAIVALNFGPRTATQHELETSTYEVQQMSDLAKSAAWLDSQLPAGATILTTTREGKWVEGLTGRAALFSIPVRYSFRDVERSRSVAAETLIRSTTSLTNGSFFIKYADRKVTSSGYVPREPWIGVNHGGEYLDMVRILPTETGVADKQGTTLATLNSLGAVSAETSEGQDSIDFSTFWQGERKGGTISYERTLSLRDNSESFDVVDEASGSLPVSEMEMKVRPVSGMQITSVDIGPGYVELRFSDTGAGEPRLRINAVGQEVEFEQASDGVIARAHGASRLHLQFTALTSGKPIFQLGIFHPEQLIASYDVGGIVLQQEPALESRLKRLSALGFAPAEQFGPYVVLMRTASDTALKSDAAQAAPPNTSGES